LPPRPQLPRSSSTPTRSLHDALPICETREGVAAVETVAPARLHVEISQRAPAGAVADPQNVTGGPERGDGHAQQHRGPAPGRGPDRKSTRLNSSHVKSSYAVFCLKKK